MCNDEPELSMDGILRWMIVSRLYLRHSGLQVSSCVTKSLVEKVKNQSLYANINSEK